MKHSRFLFQSAVCGTISFLFLIFLFSSRVQAFTLLCEKGAINWERVIVGDCPSLPTGKGFRLKDGLTASQPTDAPDVVLQAEIPEAGLWRFWSTAAVTEPVKERLKLSRSKMDSIPIFISINDGLASSRYVIEPWRNLDSCKPRLGLFDLPKGPARIQIWLPEGVWLASLDLAKYSPPRVPEAAENYLPPIVPPQEHPRIMIRPAILPEIRERLAQGENLKVWEGVQARAKSKVNLTLPEDRTVGHNASLLRSIQCKAFVYLMERDEVCGKEAVDLAVRYLERVEYGNLLDVTREMGQTIVAASYVYDWCYPLLGEQEKASLEKNLRRLADQMECGWPPFGQTIINGHGAEAQIMRDLFVMSLALYESDPTPYRYCAYRILEELVPQRRWEYQSPRHNQGINYGNYRIHFEYCCDLLFERFCGKRVFDQNLADMPLYYLSLRLPDGTAIPDGDCYCRSILNYAPAALLMGAYGVQSPKWEKPQAVEGDYANPDVQPTRVDRAQLARLAKAQYFRERGKRLGSDDPVFFLLVNDPNVSPDFSFESIPLGFDSGSRLGSQVVRTGWMNESWLLDGQTADPDSNDVVVEMKGAGYFTRNHQHLDAGAFQIYFRGWLTRDLGIYHFYGLPYDMNFNKRSSAHNVCLIMDPNAEKQGGFVNDGSQIYAAAFPKTPLDVAQNPEMNTGRVLESVFEPSAMKPERSSYRVDLTAAYADRAESYVRSFRWIRTGRPDAPVVLAVLDRMTVKEPRFHRFWQMNTLNKPFSNGKSGAEEGWLAESCLPKNATVLPGRLHLTSLLPSADERSVELIGDERANSIRDVQFTVPIDVPEAKGWRMLLEDKNPQGEKTSVFLNVIQVLGEKSDGSPAEPLPVQWKEENGEYRIQVGDEIFTIR